MEEILYKTVPKEATLSTDPIKKRSREDVEQFLSSSLPNNRVAEIESLQHKHTVLDAVKQKWKRRTGKKNVRNVFSCQERKKLKVFDIKKDGQKFENYIPLHRLWQDYMRDLVDVSRLKEGVDKKSKQIQENLTRADYHGCMIVVKKTKCPSLMGISGIVLMETKNTFRIVTKDDQVKCVPKQNCVFAFVLDGFVFTIYGNHFCVRAGERIKKSFKTKPTIDLS